MTDAMVLRSLGERLAQHRLARNLTQAELAREAGVSRRTLVRMEAGESTQLLNLVRVLRALDLLDGLEGVLPEIGPSPMEQWRQRGKERRRASGRAREDETGGASWSWGEEESP